MPKNQTATWSFSLDTECPKCKKEADLTNHPDFWDGNSDLKIGEHRQNFKATCPECGENFMVDLEY